MSANCPAQRFFAAMAASLRCVGEFWLSFDFFNFSARGMALLTICVKNNPAPLIATRYHYNELILPLPQGNHSYCRHSLIKAWTTPSRSPLAPQNAMPSKSRPPPPHTMQRTLPNVASSLIFNHLPLTYLTQLFPQRPYFGCSQLCISVWALSAEVKDQLKENWDASKQNHLQVART